MSDQETRGAIQPAEIVRDDHPAERRPERPPVAAFDPHFGSLSGGRESSEFDEMMWESAA